MANKTRAQAPTPTNFPEPPMQESRPAEASHEPVREFAGQPGPKLGKAVKTTKTEHGAIRTDLA